MRRAAFTAAPRTAPSSAMMRSASSFSRRHRSEGDSTSSPRIASHSSKKRASAIAGATDRRVSDISRRTAPTMRGSRALTRTRRQALPTPRAIGYFAGSPPPGSRRGRSSGRVRAPARAPFRPARRYRRSRACRRAGRAECRPRGGSGRRKPPCRRRPAARRSRSRWRSYDPGRRSPARAPAFPPRLEDSNWIDGGRRINLLRRRWGREGLLHSPGGRSRLRTVGSAIALSDFNSRRCARLFGRGCGAEGSGLLIPPPGRRVQAARGCPIRAAGARSSLSPGERTSHQRCRWPPCRRCRPRKSGRTI